MIKLLYCIIDKTKALPILLNLFVQIDFGLLKKRKRKKDLSVPPEHQGSLHLQVGNYVITMLSAFKPLWLEQNAHFLHEIQQGFLTLHLQNYEERMMNYAIMNLLFFIVIYLYCNCTIL